MRPLRLELRGFTAFRNETVVDFEHRHLFAITGPTGAGKSSLLDAITWALYGQVPRVGNQARQLMSQGATAMAVRFDFRARNETYRVSRQIGKTMAARLDREVAPGEWRSVADKARDVASEVERILGLDYETFTKTVLLPQGAFDAFLRGDPGTRRDILSNLLGLATYETMREQAQARVVGARNRAEEQRQQADRLPDATAEAIATLDAERAERQARIGVVQAQRERLAELVTAERASSECARDAASAQAAATAAAETHALAVRARDEAQKALDGATAHLAALEAERIALGYDAERHRTLEQQAAQARQVATARADLARAEEALTAAQATLDAAKSEATTASKAANAASAQQMTATTALDAARATLATAAGHAVLGAARLREQHAHLDGERGDVERAALAAEERVRRLDALATQAAEVTGDLERADAEAQRTTAAAAVAEAERLRAEADLTSAVATQEAAIAARETATRAHSAAALRRGLSVGDPCPVCGEPITSLVEHAAPDLDIADAAVTEAERVLQAARAAHEQRLGDARSAHARAEAATEALTTVRTRLAALEAACGEAGVALAHLDAERAQATTDATATRARVADIDGALAATAEAERAVALLIATIPAEVQPDAEPRGDTDDIAQPLRHALTVYAAASQTAREAEDATRRADEAARAAETATAHAAERLATASTAATEARERLAALGVQQEAEASAVLTALAELEQQAARHAAIEAEQRTAEQARAVAASLLEDRTRAVTLASGDAEERARIASVAATRAHDATEAYAVRWRELKDVAAAPDAAALAEMDRRLGQMEIEAATTLGVLEARIAQAHAGQAEAERLRSEAARHEQTMHIAGALEQDLRRNNFIAFVQREAMQVLATEAADRMEHLSRGRYRMRAEGDEFVVIDRLNGDEQRSVKTLSGGETFLASLALALALAERLPQLSGHGGALSLESLFLDEGFGTLDADALDVAIEALELLAGDRRMIGVISHVPLIAERLPDHIEVVRVGSSSTVRG